MELKDSDYLAVPHSELLTSLLIAGWLRLQVQILYRMHGMQGTREYRLLLYSPDTIMTNLQGQLQLGYFQSVCGQTMLQCTSTTCVCMRVRKERIPEAKNFQGFWCLQRLIDPIGCYSGCYFTCPVYICKGTALLHSNEDGSLLYLIPSAVVNLASAANHAGCRAVARESSSEFPHLANILHRSSTSVRQASLFISLLPHLMARIIIVKAEFMNFRVSCHTGFMLFLWWLSAFS